MAAPRKKRVVEPLEDPSAEIDEESDQSEDIDEDIDDFSDQEDDGAVGQVGTCEPVWGGGSGRSRSVPIIT